MALFLKALECYPSSILWEACLESSTVSDQNQGFYRGRGSPASRIEACGERIIGAKDAISRWTLA
jgi:hypothetical protein